MKCKHDLIRMWQLLHFRIVAHMLMQQTQPKCFHSELKSFRDSLVIVVSAVQQVAEIKLLILLHKIHMAHCYCHNTLHSLITLFIAQPNHAQEHKLVRGFFFFFFTQMDTFCVMQNKYLPSRYTCILKH